MVFSDIGRVRAFALVLDLGSISAAATVLGYTQSAVSQQLAALEREVGLALVDRSTRPLGPTPAGAALRPHVDRLLAELGAAASAVEDLRAGTGRRLRLAAFPSALSSFVPPAVRELRRTEQELVVEVVQCETLEAVEAVRERSAELAVVHHMPGVPVPAMPDMERHPLLVDELCVVMAAAHRLAGRREVRTSDLDGEPLLVPRRGTPAGRFRSLVEHLCAQAGFSPRVAYEIDDLAAAQAFAAAGIALVLMHRLTLAAQIPGVVAHALADGGAGSRRVEAVVPVGGRPALVDDLLAHLTRSAARQEG